MNILIDTNIFIYRDVNDYVFEDMAELSAILSKIGVSLFVHPASNEDLSHDKNQKRKVSNLTKIKKYPYLEDPPSWKDDLIFQEKIGKLVNTNDQIDAELLYSIYRNAANYLITEDAEIIKNAKKLNLQSRVFDISQSLDFFRAILPQGSSVKIIPALNEEYVYSVDVNDPIFLPLKKSYPEFEIWFDKCCLNHRKCLSCYSPNGDLGGILIYKVEDEIIESYPEIVRKKRLKICTFIVKNVGKRIGELFIKMSIDLAKKNDIDEIYLTYIPQNEHHLLALLEGNGFDYVANLIKNKEEGVYIKKLVASSKDMLRYCPVDISRKFYPSFYDGNNVKKFIVPIQPEYYDRLFTDNPIERQTKLLEQFGEFIVEGNSITKVYISNKRIKKIDSGDILIFYRSKDWRSLTAIGVVDKIIQNNLAFDEIFPQIKNRTVYSKNEIEKFHPSSTIIIFRLHQYFRFTLPYSTLMKESIIKGPPQSIVEITNVKYNKIKKLGALNERYIVN